MAIAIRSEATGTANGNVSNQIAVAKPSTISDGDYVVSILGAGDDAPALAPPVDWVNADGTVSSSGNDRQIRIAYKRVAVGTAEPATYTFTAGNGDNVAWWIGALSGVDSATPQDEPMAGNASNADNSATVTTNAINVNAGAFVLAGWATNFDGTTTLPGGAWGARADDVVNTAVSLNVVSQLFAVGTTGVSAALTGITATQETSCGIWAFRMQGTAPATSMKDLLMAKWIPRAR
jgi:hypothetical protein